MTALEIVLLWFLIPTALGLLVWVGSALYVIIRLALSPKFRRELR